MEWEAALSHLHPAETKIKQSMHHEQQKMTDMKDREKGGMQVGLKKKTKKKTNELHELMNNCNGGFEKN